MGVWPDPMRGAAFAALIWLGLGAPVLAQSENMDCAEEIVITAAGASDLDLHVAFPCRPYAAIDVRYGPILIPEELSQDGTLFLALPRIAGISDIRVDTGPQQLTGSVPNGAASLSGSVAVFWTDQPRWGVLQDNDGNTSRQLGFPGRADLPGLDLLVTGADEIGLSVPITQDTCGRSLKATIQTAQAPEPEMLSLSVPSCALVGHSVWIPVS
ncbi:hypothetical protein [Pseudoruegeria sp. SK021]|uniref:hypothetical protein n=1 Tax=Pseudoruegeria sp. SK021 TaxID=1933035 RepID=UPI000A2281EE|nr:hypothetical protein [Pseudoruegeria sp. SK021]OSP54648.1 hypothetical protein BV911_11660 [Pseudoruegeria sp. SK021]